jgi:signal transduction histidine kinase
VTVDVLVFSSSLGGREPASGEGRLLIVAYALVAGLLLLARRRAPLAVFGALLTHSLLARLIVPASYPTACLLVGLASVAYRRPTRESVPALLGAFLASSFIVHEAVVTETDPALRTGTMLATAGAYLLFDTGAWAVGWWSGRTGRRVAEVEERRSRELEEQRARAEAALAAERGRIARELHDIVAHSVTVMVLQAAGARRVIGRRPDLAVPALTTIEEVGTRAMGELRRLLGVLRESDAAGSAAGTQPLAGLAELARLLDAVGSNGIEAKVEVAGTPQPLDVSVDLAAYRVIQEGLTNVAKHAGPGSTCRVAMDWTVDRLVVTVQDDGAGTAASGADALSTGNGLLGLRERVAIVGGSLSAGPVDAGGFRLQASLPTAIRPPRVADVVGGT